MGYAILHHHYTSATATAADADVRECSRVSLEMLKWFLTISVKYKPAATAKGHRVGWLISVLTTEMKLVTVTQTCTWTQHAHKVTG